MSEPAVLLQEKRCGRCKEVKPRDDFRINKRSKSHGLQSYCKPCEVAYDAEYRARDPERYKKQQARYSKEARYRDIEKARRRERKARIRFNYGLPSYEAYLKLMEPPCAICGRESQVLDHNHDTGAIRQALCRACNTGLGVFHDSAEELEVAVAYIRKHERALVEED